VRRPVSQRLRLWFRLSIHREEEVSEDMSPITGLHLLVADRRHAELCVLGCKFVVRQPHVRAYPKHLAGFLVIISSFFDHEFFPLLVCRDYPLIQSP
jgi:hypothetical protein